MVLEASLSAKWAEKDFLRDFFFAFLIGCVALTMSHTLFNKSASIFAIALISVATVTLLTKVLGKEEKKAYLAAKKGYEGRFLEEHEPAIQFLLTYFFAIVCVFAMFYFVLPPSAHSIFEIQFEGISELSALEQAHPITSFASNLVILVSTFIVALVFGGGIAFVLTWNASVAGVLLGMVALDPAGNSPILLLLILPELLAYHIAGIAGGIMSAGITRHGIRGKAFKYITRDVSKLIALAVVNLVFVVVLQRVFM